MWLRWNGSLLEWEKQWRRGKMVDRSLPYLWTQPALDWMEPSSPAGSLQPKERPSKKPSLLKSNVSSQCFFQGHYYNALVYFYLMALSMSSSLVFSPAWNYSSYLASGFEVIIFYQGHSSCWEYGNSYTIVFSPWVGDIFILWLLSPENPTITNLLLVSTMVSFFSSQWESDVYLDLSYQWAFVLFHRTN